MKVSSLLAKSLRHELTLASCKLTDIVSAKPTPLMP